MATLLGQKKGKKIDVATDGERLVYSATREYIVYDATGTEGEGSILTSAGIPFINTLHSFAGVPALLMCKSKTAQQFENNNKYWTVSASFDNQPSNPEEGSGQNENDPNSSGDPTTWYSLYKFSFTSYEDVLWHEANFAGRPYASPLTVNRLIPCIKFTQYLPPTVTLYDIASNFHEHVNDAEFLGAIARSWLLEVNDAEFGVTNGFPCWKVSFDLKWKITVISSDYEVYTDNQDEVTAANNEYPGWDLYVPQFDTIDKDDAPFVDKFENAGDIGKLGLNGLFFTNQTNPFLIKLHTPRKARSFNFIRLRQNQ